MLSPKHCLTSQNVAIKGSSSAENRQNMDYKLYMVLSEAVKMKICLDL
jgi:hypothetical protein